MDSHPKKALSRNLAVDSMPLPVCHAARAGGSALAACEGAGKGYCASKKMFWHGVKLHAVAAANHIVAKFWFTGAARHDIAAFRETDHQYRPKTRIFGDKAYNCATTEAKIACGNARLLPIRKKNMLCADNTEAENQRRGKKRKPVETVFSMLSANLGGRIFANSLEGFKRKVECAVMAHNVLQYLWLSKGYYPNFNR
jgi:hypothetical protein